MTDASVEFTNVTSLRAEALGEPGQRTFRILVDSGSSSAVMWLEKGQLFQLALAITRLLASLPEGQGTSGARLGGREAPASTRLEFSAGRLLLGHDGTGTRFVIDAHDPESGEDDAPTIRVWGDRSQVEAFADESLRVCAAGRPLCPLCGGPVDPTGHRCPRTNGHRVLDTVDL